MAVTLPSDLVMDVMRNADPARRNGAVARLQARGTASPTDFAAVIKDGAPANSGAAGGTSGGALTASAVRKDGAAGAFRGFERMVLRNLFESLLPDADSGSFGTGPSAGMWRSLAADQLAGVYADAGGAGLARMMAGKAGEPGPSREAQWPYFSLGRIEAFSGEGEAT